MLARDRFASVAFHFKVDDDLTCFVLHTEHFAVLVGHGSQVLHRDFAQINVGGFAARAGREQQQQGPENHRSCRFPEKSFLRLHD